MRSLCKPWRGRFGKLILRFDPIAVRLMEPLNSIRRDRTESTVFTTVVSGSHGDAEAGRRVFEACSGRV